MFHVPEFLELIRPQDSHVADHFDIYCNASGYPTPDVTWFKVRGPGVVLIELRESADVYIETTYPSGCRVTSRLLLFDDSISEVLCRASQEGRSSIREATFILHGERGFMRMKEISIQFILVFHQNN